MIKGMGNRPSKKVKSSAFFEELGAGSLLLIKGPRTRQPSLLMLCSSSSSFSVSGLVKAKEASR